MIQHVILRPGQPPAVEQAESLTYSQIVAIVGYPVEVINLNGATMYTCEVEDGQHNEAATKLARNVLREQPVSGTALVVGPLGAGGVDTSLPDESLTAVLAAVG